MIKHTDHLDEKEKENEVDTFHMDNQSPHPKVSFSNDYFENFKEDFEKKDNQDTEVAEDKEDSIFVNSNDYDYVFEKPEEEDPSVVYIGMPKMPLCIASLAMGIIGLVMVCIIPIIGLFFSIGAIVTGTLGQGEATERPTIAKVGIVMGIIIIVITPWSTWLHMNIR